MRATVLIALGIGVAVLILAISGRDGHELKGKPPDQPERVAAKYEVREVREGGTSSVATEMQTENSVPTNFLAQLAAGEFPSLTLEKVHLYLERNKRNAESLLAAARATGDRSLLQEAMEKYPNDPRVAFDAVFRRGDQADHRQWVEAFKQSAPDNALPNYVSALDYLKRGDTANAIEATTGGEIKARGRARRASFPPSAKERPSIATAK